MTLAILTPTKHTAWLSTDTAMTSADAYDHLEAGARAAATDDLQAALAELKEPSAAAKVQVAGHVSKLHIIPHAQTAMVVVGSLLAALHYGNGLRVAQARDVEDLDALAPDMLSRIREKLGREDIVVLHAGWSERHSEARAYAYIAGNDFRSQLLDRGLTITPLPVPDDPDYAALKDRWCSAAAGQDVVGFHVAAAQNIARAAKAGRYSVAAAIGGQLHTATISRDGIAIRRSHAFDDGEA